MVLVKIAVLAIALLIASVNFLRNAPRLRAAERRPDLVPGAAKLLYKLVERRNRPRRRDHLLRRPPDQPGPALAGARAGGEGERDRRAGRGHTRGRGKRLQGRAPDRAQPRRRPQRLLDQGDQGRQAGDRRARHHRLLDAGHGDGHAVLRLPRERARASTRARRPRSSWSATGGSPSRSSRPGRSRSPSSSSTRQVADGLDSLRCFAGRARRGRGCGRCRDRADPSDRRLTDIPGCMTKQVASTSDRLRILLRSTGLLRQVGSPVAVTLFVLE